MCGGDWASEKLSGRVQLQNFSFQPCCILDYVVILQGEIRGLSLFRLKVLNEDEINMADRLCTEKPRDIII